MDVSAFSESGFNAVEWINKTFRSVDQKEKEVRISSMVTKLQLYVQQANSALEETSQQVLQNMPEVIHDMAAIQKEALSLKEKMYYVKEEISKIDKGTENSLSDLSRLDNIKIELLKAKQAIQEADKWTLLANEIEDAFESHKIDEIALKIVSMQQSLVVLKNSNDSEDKKLQLEGFKNRLEAIVSPHLLKAFTSSNIDESKRFVKIFQSMDRLNQMIKYYCKCHKSYLCQQWSSTIELDQDQTVNQWLKTYYDFLLSNWQTQVKWCLAVFKTCDMLPGIYCEVLEAIDSSVVNCIDSALKQQHDHLPYLINLKEISKNFANNFTATLQQQGLYSDEIWCQLYCAIVSPYIGYISRYCQLEERHLLDQISNPQPSDLMDTVQSLAHRNTAVSGFCMKGIKRCVNFTESLAFSALIQALQYCLKKFLEEYRTALRQIDVDKVSTEEWTMFKICLTLLQRIGEFLLEVRHLDQELIQTIICQSNADKEVLEIRSSLLKKTTIQDYYTLIKNIKEGTVVSVLGDDVLGRLEKLCSKVYQSCVGVMSSRVAGHLADTKVWWEGNSNQLQPDYSYVPLEYITQIGEYLMTLPQHLEPFVLREDGSLLAALSCVRQPGDTSAPADYILGNIARLTCTHYTDIILSLSHLSEHSAKQLAVDIGYLGCVLEDLGHSLSENLSQINQLLRIPADSYVIDAQNLGCSPKLVASIRQLRNITSS